MIRILCGEEKRGKNIMTEAEERKHDKKDETEKKVWEKKMRNCNVDLAYINFSKKEINNKLHTVKFLHCNVNADGWLTEANKRISFFPLFFIFFFFFCTQSSRAEHTKYNDHTFLRARINMKRKISKRIFLFTNTTYLKTTSTRLFQTIDTETNWLDWDGKSA